MLRASLIRLIVVSTTTLHLQGCEIEVDPPAHYDVPAYGWNTLISVEESIWRSCHLDTGSNTHIRQQWSFAINTLRISEHRHGSADTDCSGSSTLIWRHDYGSAEDGDLAVALGWVDEAGVQTLNGGAPDSQDEIGPLPAQPDIRRVKWEFRSFGAGTGAAPLPTGTPLRQILFIDLSADPFRLFVGPFSGSLDADGFPSYLKSYRALELVQP